jgi:nucleoid DNA-binding protein
MSMTTKDQLVRPVAERTELDMGQAKLAAQATIDEITAQLAAGNEVNSPASTSFLLCPR